MLWLNLLIPGFISGFIVYKRKRLSMLLTSIIGPILVVISLQLFEKKFLDDYHLLQNLSYLCIYGILTISGFIFNIKDKK